MFLSYVTDTGEEDAFTVVSLYAEIGSQPDEGELFMQIVPPHIIALSCN